MRNCGNVTESRPRQHHAAPSLASRSRRATNPVGAQPVTRYDINRRCAFHSGTGSCAERYQSGRYGEGDGRQPQSAATEHGQLFCRYDRG
jgi:hypothetical protein